MKFNIRKNLKNLFGFMALFSVGVNAETINPILPGFYPDPSICRAGDDYYLVNSSFSFFPGIPIFHSKDLCHWKQIGHVLDRPSQLNLTDEWMSAGLYAPSIRFHEGTFYLVTTQMGGKGGNFYVTSKNPAGPWSEPNWLKEVDGIDPSFFFDNDGTAYIVYNGPVPGKPLYNGHRSIWLQKYDIKNKKCIGNKVELVNGGVDITKKPVWIEGPHIFNHKGYYYLLCAEGGTSVEHSEVIFRSKDIWGPYKPYDKNPIMTQRDLPENRKNPVTCTGHADFVQTPEGKWVAVYLGCQPYSEDYFNTGRQTFISEVDWKGEWPIIIKKGEEVPYNVSLPVKELSGVQSFRDYSANWKDDFNGNKLKYEWNFIRTPKEKWYDLKDGTLVINSRTTSLDEVGNPSFIGRRQQHAKAEFTTAMRLQMDSYNLRNKRMEAGISAYQNEESFYKMVVENKQNKLFVTVSSSQKEIARQELSGFSYGKKIQLKMKNIEDKFYCYYSLDGKKWIQIGGTMDGKYLSTKIARGYIGTYFGLYVYGNSPSRAIFDWAEYKEIK